MGLRLSKTGQTGCCKLEINKKYTTWLQIWAFLFKVIWDSVIFFGQLISYYLCQKENDKWYDCKNEKSKKLTRKYTRENQNKKPFSNNSGRKCNRRHFATSTTVTLSSEFSSQFLQQCTCIRAPVLPWNYIFS